MGVFDAIRRVTNPSGDDEGLANLVARVFDSRAVEHILADDRTAVLGVRVVRPKALGPWRVEVDLADTGGHTTFTLDLHVHGKPLRDTSYAEAEDDEEYDPCARCEDADAVEEVGDELLCARCAHAFDDEEER